MRNPFPGLAALALVALTQLASAQDAPLIEGPYRRARLERVEPRIAFEITTEAEDGQRLFRQGLAHLHAGSDREAERCFRELATTDPGCAMAWWGLALANDRHPDRELEFAWNAWTRRAQAGDTGRRLIEAWGRAVGAEEEPEWELVDAESGRRRAHPRVVSSGARVALVRELGALIEVDPENRELRALLVRELVRGLAPGAKADDARARELLGRLLTGNSRHPAQRYRVSLSGIRLRGAEASAWQPGLSVPTSGRAWEASGRLHEPAGAESIHAHETAMRADHALAVRLGAMPCEIDGYARNVERLARSLLAAGYDDRARVLAKRLTALPRHPDFDDGAMHRGARLLIDLVAGTTTAKTQLLDAAAIGLPAPAAVGPESWTPPEAPGFDLPSGRGGRMSLASMKGRPTLVVFFLGFGCIHCVEQLHALRPRLAEFEEAGIEVVTIGTDGVDQVKASIQRQIENDSPPMPFPVLCDPLHERFKAWGCWDEFEDEPLHGTFLVAPDGRILWRDVSIEPFMDTGFLLEEFRRLLAVER